MIHGAGAEVSESDKVRVLRPSPAVESPTQSPASRALNLPDPEPCAGAHDAGPFQETLATAGCCHHAQPGTGKTSSRTPERGMGSGSGFGSLMGDARWGFTPASARAAVMCGTPDLHVALPFIIVRGLFLVR